MFNWNKKYSAARTTSKLDWAMRRGEEAYNLLGSGGMTRSQLMSALGLGTKDSLDKVLKTIRHRIYLVQAGNNRVYERRENG